MADKKISQLTSATLPLAGIVDANATTATLYKYSALASDVQTGTSFYLCIVYTV